MHIFQSIWIDYVCQLYAVWNKWSMKNDVILKKSYVTIFLGVSPFVVCSLNYVCQIKALLIFRYPVLGLGCFGAIDRQHTYSDCSSWGSSSKAPQFLKANSLHSILDCLVLVKCWSKILRMGRALGMSRIGQAVLYKDDLLQLLSWISSRPV